MDLFEYQAKELFEEYDIPTPKGELASSPEQVKSIATKFNSPVVVKAQVKIGGRGKAGGVKYAKDPEAAYKAAREIFGLDIKGHIVEQVLVVEACEIVDEYYISFILDRTSGTYLAMCSAAGGMEIEEIAQKNPEKLAKANIKPIDELDLTAAKKLAVRGGISADTAPQVAEIMVKLWKLFVEKDALLVEINPLVKDSHNDVVAVDGKITLDDNAAFRQDSFEKFSTSSIAKTLEEKAKDLGLNYVKLSGEVGIIGNGAGLVMSTLDVLAYAGEKYGQVLPANFLDIGGGASAEVMVNGLSIILDDPQVKSVLVNVFGGITACDEVARGITGAINELGAKADKPIIVRFDGNNYKEGMDILAAANNDLVTVISTMDEAADLAAQLASHSK